MYFFLHYNHKQSLRAITFPLKKGRKLWRNKIPLFFFSLSFSPTRGNHTLLLPRLRHFLLRLFADQEVALLGHMFHQLQEYVGSSDKIRQISQIQEIQEYVCSSDKICQISQIQEIQEYVCSSDKIRQISQIQEIQEYVCSLDKIRQISQIQEIQEQDNLMRIEM